MALTRRELQRLDRAQHLKLIEYLGSLEEEEGDEDLYYDRGDCQRDDERYRDEEET